ncbi:MAG: helix-turn-helix transcriptional regulator [Hyphomicrobiales bacterium]|nr:helix-turn-helix transcriptional regulator [Hyphomicrobiales bacterium]
MSRKMIPAREAVERWRKEEPGFVEAYDALEEEFSLAAALIDARARSELSQEEIAERMGTSQPAVARLESGKANPSLATLRRYAKATGTKLKIDFVVG